MTSKNDSRTCIPNAVGAMTLVVTALTTFSIYFAFPERTEHDSTARLVLYIIATGVLVLLTLGLWLFFAILNGVRLGRNCYPSYQILLAFCIATSAVGVGGFVSYFPIRPDLTIAAVILVFMCLYPLANKVLSRTCDEDDMAPV